MEQDRQWVLYWDSGRVIGKFVGGTHLQLGPISEARRFLTKSDALGYLLIQTYKNGENGRDFNSGLRPRQVERTSGWRLVSE